MELTDQFPLSGMPTRDPIQDLPPTATRLLEAAKALVERSGLSGLTFNAIAEEAGEHASLIRYYFGNKSGLVEAVVESIVHQGSPELLEAVSQAVSGHDRRHALLKTLESWADDRSEYRSFFAIISDVLQDDQLREHLRALFAWHRGLEISVLNPRPWREPNSEIEALAALTVALTDGLALMATADDAFDPKPAFSAWESMLDAHFFRLESDSAEPGLPRRGGRHLTKLGDGCVGVSEPGGTCWWERDGLRGVNGRLTVAGRDAYELADRYGTPTHLFDVQCLVDHVERLNEALTAADCPAGMRLDPAVNGGPQALAAVRARSAKGLDQPVGVRVSSLEEAKLLFRSGWSPAEIAFVGVCPTGAELAQVVKAGVRPTVSLLTELNRIGRAYPGLEVGIGVCPAGSSRAMSASPSPGSAGDQDDGGIVSASLGIREEQLDEAIGIARRHELQVQSGHIWVEHDVLGHDFGALNQQLQIGSNLIQRLLDAGCPVDEVCVGGAGGLLPHHASDVPSLSDWATAIQTHLGGLGVRIVIEPGASVSRMAGVLLARVGSLEEGRRSVLVFLDAGAAIGPAQFLTCAAATIIKCADVDATAIQPVSFVVSMPGLPGAILQECHFPHLTEGDVIALLGVGSGFQVGGDPAQLASILLLERQ